MKAETIPTRAHCRTVADNIEEASKLMVQFAKYLQQDAKGFCDAARPAFGHEHILAGFDRLKRAMEALPKQGDWVSATMH